MTPASVETTLARLRDAAAGLLFPSESDFPIEPFRWGEGVLSPEGLLRALGRPLETPVETLGIRELFDPVLETLEGEEAEQLGRLAELLSTELADGCVYRVGRVDIEVVVLGRHPSGEWLGVKTRVVET
jgi:Nuclease A inhibitor-like protein